MDQLMDMAGRAADQAEVYHLEGQSDRIQFENGRLKEIESKLQSGFSLRLIKEGRLGFAYTKNLLDRPGFLQQALSSLAGRVEAPFDFPPNPARPELMTFDPALPEISNSDLVEEGRRVADYLASRVQGEVNITIHRDIRRLRLQNSRGCDQSLKSSNYFLNASVLFPGSQAGLDRHMVEKGFQPLPEEKLDFLPRIFNLSMKEARPRQGRMKCLFLPETVYALVWRLQAGLNGKNIFEKTSPVKDKLESPVLDSRITIYDDPLNDRRPQARGFDDEGTACRVFPLIEHGVLKNFYYDLYYAGKMKTRSTGHGYKSAMWGGETVALRPRPALEYLYLKPGEKSFEEMLGSMDRGILVAGVLGAHSGNILNGDFSLGLAPGIYIEKGQIIGRVKEAMAAGNIYESLKEVAALEDTAHPTYGGTFPALLLDGVSVVM